ncbi:hypothetical protein H5P36_25095 [Bacillus sp. APMAM]|nr:hypothetical protein [Bacillus sp. APMAM]RTZ53136.1 hypothetical protein EKO25_25030 [Bacillus sp. SAJ1]
MKKVKNLRGIQGKKVTRFLFTTSLALSLVLPTTGAFASETNDSNIGSVDLALNSNEQDMQNQQVLEQKEKVSSILQEISGIRAKSILQSDKFSC